MMAKRLSGPSLPGIYFVPSSAIECKDHLHLCRRFRRFCNSEKTENKAFMELHCPLSCGKCFLRRGRKITGQKIKMSDWSKL